MGTVVFSNITISDIDSGVNSLVNLFCVQSLDCRSFSVQLKIVSLARLDRPIIVIRNFFVAMNRSGLDKRPIQGALSFAKACKIMFDSGKVAGLSSGFWFFPHFILPCHCVNGKIMMVTSHVKQIVIEQLGYCVLSKMRGG